MNGAQLSLFNPNRYSPVSAAVMFQLPESSARSFMIATTIGPWLHIDGSRKKVRTGTDYAGTLVRRKHRLQILSALGIGESRWLQLVKDWESRYIAHICAPGVVFLFAKWLEDECPACHAEMLRDHGLPPGPHRPRGRGFTKGHRYYPPGTTTTDFEAISGTTTTGSPVVALRPFERDSDTRQERGLQGGYRQ